QEQARSPSVPPVRDGERGLLGGRLPRRKGTDRMVQGGRSTEGLGASGRAGDRELVRQAFRARVCRRNPRGASLVLRGGGRGIAGCPVLRVLEDARASRDSPLTRA